MYVVTQGRAVYVWSFQGFVSLYSTQDPPFLRLDWCSQHFLKFLQNWRTLPGPIAWLWHTRMLDNLSRYVFETTCSYSFRYVFPPPSCLPAFLFPLRSLIILDNAIALLGLVAPHFKLVIKKKKGYVAKFRVISF